MKSLNKSFIESHRHNHAYHDLLHRRSPPLNFLIHYFLLFPSVLSSFIPCLSFSFFLLSIFLFLFLLRLLFSLNLFQLHVSLLLSLLFPISSSFSSFYSFLFLLATKDSIFIQFQLLLASRFSSYHFFLFFFHLLYFFLVWLVFQSSEQIVPFIDVVQEFRYIFPVRLYFPIR